MNSQIDENWMSIDIAPKDGEEILIGFSDGRVRQVSWQPTFDSSYPFAWKDYQGNTVVRPWKDDEEPICWMPCPKVPRTLIP